MISILIWLYFWVIVTQFVPFTYWKNVLKKARFSSSKTYSTDLLLGCILHCHGFFPIRNACLIQAFVFWSLVDKNKDVCFVIGVQKNEKNIFEAHAWIENQSKILIGKRPLDYFTPIWRYRNA